MGQRVAIIDIDLHHGNGTEEILMAGALRRFNRPCSEAGAPSRVAFLSVHQYDEAQFPQTGAVSPCKEEHPFIINELLDACMSSSHAGLVERCVAYSM